MKTYYIHPMAFGSTQDPGHGHVPVVHADDFEKLRAKLEAAEKRIAELEARKPDLYLCRVNRGGEELYSPCGKDYPRGRGYIAAAAGKGE
ncbi:hypothetical protein [Enterobacter sichuanensis]|uniref:hypothetical protein n=1 Tax=Enterobacter sichuanensis TaxID=2071710 RepID=UPI000CEE2D4E|nr:hypothetical protein [Enterobacter sichuanensis]